MSKKANTILYTDNLLIDGETGSVTLDLHLQSEKGKLRVIRVKFGQYDMSDLAPKFYKGLNQADATLAYTRRSMSGDNN